MGSDRPVKAVANLMASADTDFRAWQSDQLMVFLPDDQCLVACAYCSGPIDGDGSNEGVVSFALALLLITKGIETFVGTGPLW